MSRSLGLVLGFAADRAFADPQRGHPVAGFGRLASALEGRLWADDRARGAMHVAVLVGGTAALGALAERAVRGRPVAHTLLTATATWAVLGGTTLDREASAVEGRLADGDLPGARAQVGRLVGRATDGLDEAGVARAVIESVAENTSDAVVAPLVLGALAGVPGLLAYRAANTLDAMVGHRSARYERFGWAAARLDDLLNLPGARLTAGLATALGANPRGALRAWRRDAAAHPSPNAGPVEAAFAGALGIRLGGTNRYGDRVEHRAVLGDGRAPEAHDVPRARALAQKIDVAALIVLLPVARSIGGRRRRRSPR
jgi:adenosylcobinamide-phosphate synthase